MDARGGLALRVSGGLELLSDGSGWRGYLYPLFSLPAGSWLTAHARPGPVGDSDIPERGVLVPTLHTRPGAAAQLPPHLHPTCAGLIAAAAHAQSDPGRRLGHPSDGSGWRGYLRTFIPPAPAGSRSAAHARLATRTRIPGMLPPARHPIRHSPGRGFGPPNVTARGVDCAGVLPAARFPSVAHRAAGQGLRLLVASVWPASPLSPFRPGRCRRHADSDTNIPSGRSVRCAIDDC